MTCLLSCDGFDHQYVQVAVGNKIIIGKSEYFTVTELLILFLERNLRLLY